MSFCDEGADGKFWWKQEGKRHAPKRMMINFTDFKQRVTDEEVTISTRSTPFVSFEMECHGLKWKLRIDQVEQNSNKGLELFLVRRDIDEDHDHVLHLSAFATVGSFHVALCSNRTILCDRVVSPYIEISDILDPAQDHLVDGNLKIVVYIPYLLNTTKKPLPCWQPQQDDSFKNLWLSARHHTDVLFLVKGKEIPAHKCVLEVCVSRSLMDLVNDSHNDLIEINNTDPLLFETAIVHMYIGEIPDIFTKDVAKALSLLDVANKYGFTSLKVKLDFELATHLITAANAAELFVFADSRCCALLKENAMKQLNINPDESKKSKGWVLVREAPDLMEELWSNASSKQPKTDPHDEEISLFDGLSVSSLRYSLEEVGLDLDGSRDMLVMRLKDFLPNLDVLYIEDA